MTDVGTIALIKAAASEDCHPALKAVARGALHSTGLTKVRL